MNRKPYRVRRKPRLSRALNWVYRGGGPANQRKTIRRLLGLR